MRPPGGGKAPERVPQAIACRLHRLLSPRFDDPCVEASYLQFAARGSEAVQRFFALAISVCAAALWALMDCGIVDALPDRDCPGLSSAELIAAARETTERAPAADAADAVARLLRHLALLKFCDESPTWRFRHSARSQAFASDNLARSRALSNLSPALVRPWWRVSEALHQNETPFSLEHGEGAWDYLSENERDASRFDSLMKGLSEKGGAERSLVALGASDAAFAWSELPPGSRVIDVGGGEGHLLAKVLRRGVRRPRIDGVES